MSSDSEHESTDFGANLTSHRLLATCFIKRKLGSNQPNWIWSKFKHMSLWLAQECAVSHLVMPVTCPEHWNSIDNHVQNTTFEFFLSSRYFAVSCNRTTASICLSGHRSSPPFLRWLEAIVLSAIEQHRLKILNTWQITIPLNVFKTSKLTLVQKDVNKSVENDTITRLRFVKCLVQGANSNEVITSDEIFFVEAVNFFVTRILWRVNAHRGLASLR